MSLGVVATRAQIGQPIDQRHQRGAGDYFARLDNLDTSYYTYSYYGVDSQGDKVLESLAIRRLNDTDPNVNAVVAGKSALDGGVYLTAANWDAYVSELVSLGYDVAEFGAKPFNDASVQDLIETAFGQTLRTDVKAPIIDGLQVTHTASGNVDTVEIESLQDDAGFYLPKTVKIQRTITETISVPSAYVVGKKAGTEYTVTYDSVLGLNDHGLWLGSFETAYLNVNLQGPEPAVSQS